jgi:hypothetical protein
MASTLTHGAVRALVPLLLVSGSMLVWSGVAGARQATDWALSIRDVRFPDDPGQPVEFTIDAQQPVPDGTAVRYESWLRLPSGELVSLGQVEWPAADGSSDTSGTTHFQWADAEAGPYAIRVVRSDRGTDEVVAELDGWVGSPTVPVLTIDGVQVDRTVARVGDPVAVTVSMTNHGQTRGSRPAAVWVWLDNDPPRQIGSVLVRDLAAGESGTDTVTWRPEEAANATVAAGLATSRKLAQQPLTVVADTDPTSVAAQ